MQYTLDQLYRHLCQKIDNTYLVFQNFFGEDYVDLQMKRNPAVIKQNIVRELENKGISYTKDTNTQEKLFEVSNWQLASLHNTIAVGRAVIYVWWPTVVVTNEHDKSVVIQDLYAKIEINSDGTIPYECAGFLLNRATYTKTQFLSDYMHSHIQGIPKRDFSNFLRPCLGTGPIRETIASLRNDYDEVTWMLFCQELADYVTVESLHGGPWRRLEEIGSNSTVAFGNNYDFSFASITYFLKVFSKDQLRDFIQYYLQHGHLVLSFRNGRFTCSMPYTDFIVDISNAFIDFYNLYLKSTAVRRQTCFDRTILRNVEIRNGLIYYVTGRYNNNPANISYYQGQHVLTFKGKDITTTITEEEGQEQAESVIIVDPPVAMHILGHILKIINYRYKNGYKHRTDKETATTGQRVCYL